MADMKQLLTLILFLCFIFSPHPIFAAKARVKSVAKAVVSTTNRGYSSVKLSRNTNSVVLSLFNLSGVKKISYELSYVGSGVEQGALGTIQIAGQSTDGRDLYFGTCSHGVCTPHTNIKDATLTISTTLNNGSKQMKRYRIKV